MTTVRRSKHRRGIWTKIFGWGLLLWVLSAVVTYATANVLLVPTLVLLGSFLVPVTFAAWAFERGRSDEITTQLLFQTFVVGGVLGRFVPPDRCLGPVAGEEVVREAVGEVVEVGEVDAVHDHGR